MGRRRGSLRAQIKQAEYGAMAARYYANMAAMLIAPAPQQEDDHLQDLPRWAVRTPAGQESPDGRVLYVAKWCGWCKKALAEIKTRHGQNLEYPPFQVVECGDPESSARVRNEVQGYPTAYIGGQKMPSYESLFQ
jgi:hypothetical protein